MGMTKKIQPWKKIGSMGRICSDDGNQLGSNINMNAYMELHRKRNSNTSIQRRENVSNKGFMKVINVGLVVRNSNGLTKGWHIIHTPDKCKLV